MMEYKGYVGVVEFDGEDRVFHGKVIDLHDVIGFEGQSVDELENSMQHAVDAYLCTCERLGKTPERPYSGKIFVRADASLHRAVSNAAAAARQSINEWAVETFKQRLGWSPPS